MMPLTDTVPASVYENYTQAQVMADLAAGTMPITFARRMRLLNLISGVTLNKIPVPYIAPFKVLDIHHALNDAESAESIIAQLDSSAMFQALAVGDIDPLWEEAQGTTKLLAGFTDGWIPRFFEEPFDPVNVMLAMRSKLLLEVVDELGHSYDLMKMLRLGFCPDEDMEGWPPGGEDDTMPPGIEDPVIPPPATDPDAPWAEPPAPGEPGYEPPEPGEPGYIPPSPGEPGSEPPAPGEPGYVPPAPGEPGYTPPAPGPGEPGYTPPAPGPGEPGYAPPGPGEPGYAPPGPAEPGTGDPGTGEPGTGGPGPGPGGPGEGPGAGPGSGFFGGVGPGYGGSYGGFSDPFGPTGGGGRSPGAPAGGGGAVDCCADDDGDPVTIYYEKGVLDCSETIDMYLYNLAVPCDVDHYEFVLAAGGGTLNLDEDGFLESYTAPATNPGGVNDPTIQLFCEDELYHEFTLTIVDPCTGEGGVVPSIGYTTLGMQVNEVQTLTATPPLADGSLLTWAITAGGGSLSSAHGNSVDYTAPAANAFCLDNPTITLSCGGEVIDTISLAVNAWTGAQYAYRQKECQVEGSCSEGVTFQCALVVGFNYKCTGVKITPQICATETAGCTGATCCCNGGGECTFHYQTTCANRKTCVEAALNFECTAAGTPIMSGYGLLEAEDIRAEWLIEYGCCPAAVL